MDSSRWRCPSSIEPRAPLLVALVLSLTASLAPTPSSAQGDDEFDPRFDVPAPPADTTARTPADALTPPPPAGYVPAPPPPPAQPLFAPAPAPSPSGRGDRAHRRRARWAPPLSPGDRFELRLMPFVSKVVGGVLGLAEWRHQTRSGFWTSVRLGPFGVARSAPDNIGVADGAVFLGMAWRLFSVGLGGGAGMVRLEEPTRRTSGAAPTYLLSLRAGALYGVHFSLTVGGAIVQGHGVAVLVRMRLRVPIRHHDLLDFDIDAAQGLAWVYTGVSWERGLGDRDHSRLRIRPNVGIVEVIDPVRRAGGAGLSLGVALVYRTDGPMPESEPSAGGS